MWTAAGDYTTTFENAPQGPFFAEVLLSGIIPWFGSPSFAFHERPSTRPDKWSSFRCTPDGSRKQNVGWKFQAWMFDRTCLAP